MKHLFFILLFNSLLLSKVYYSKLEPYELRNISSNVSGIVLFADENMLGRKLNSQPFIKIDTDLDYKEIRAIKDKLNYLKTTIDTNQKVIKNLEQLLEKKRTNYNNIKSLKIKSTLEKDKEFYDLVNSENNYFNTLKEINNLRIQIADLEYRKQQLERSIEDKNIKADGFVLYSLAVKPGQVVGIATPLAQIADVSKGLLTIYVDQEELENITNKRVFLDGVETKYKVSRFSRIADSKNISKYMAQIIISSPSVFSRLVKVELK